MGSTETQPGRRFPRSWLDQALGDGPSSSASAQPLPKHTRRLAGPSTTEDTGDFICKEVTRGRKRVYLVQAAAREGQNTLFEIVDDQVTNRKQLIQTMHRYLLPDGFPDSVAPQYQPYMAWRGAQYFFGGAIGVFTTRSLLGALGIAGRRSGEAAAAVNWVLKDGAGRLGRFLFARWGRELDCELKQFRFAGDILMEVGAAMELTTISFPRAFLPLACTANLAKNLAAVAASSTRAPIYRSFALQNNLAEVTAKGESVANLADIAGTVFGIALSSKNSRFGLVPTFLILSSAYLLASRRAPAEVALLQLFHQVQWAHRVQHRREVDSVELQYLNRARLAYSVRKFLETGIVPSVTEANKKEPLLPWGTQPDRRMVLGARVEDACRNVQELETSFRVFYQERFSLAYRSDTEKVYVLLQHNAQDADVLRGAFFAQVMLHMLDARHNPSQPFLKRRLLPTSADQNIASNERSELYHTAMSEANSIFNDFLDQCREAGWQLQSSVFNAQQTRVYLQ